MRIVFFGTSPFAANLLASLFDHCLDLVAIVTRPDRPKGRSQKMHSSAVKQLVLEKHPDLPLYQPEKASTEEFATLMRTFDPDLFVVVAYGEIIKANLLSIPKKGCINVHASLLPKYRGAAPMQRCLMQGEKTTGVTIIDMVLEMDAGDMLASASLPIPEEMTCGELEKSLCELAAPLLLETLKKIEKDNVKRIPQNRAEVTFAPKILPQDRLINWNLPAKQIHDQIRALSPSPGAYCQFEMGGESKQLQIKRAKWQEEPQGNPGQTLACNKEGWLIACGKGALCLLEVQLEGKRAMSAQDFMRGLRSC